MLQQICKILLKLLGWTGDGFLIPDKKCILLGAPHTSSLDFVISYIYYTSIGGKMNIMIKKEFFFWPVGFFLRKMGGIPIDRSKGANVIRQTIQAFQENDEFRLALTPEGTRKRVDNWKAGFHIIARAADIPVYVGSFDWGERKVNIYHKFELTSNSKADIKRLKDFYREKGIKGKYPELFSTEY